MGVRDLITDRIDHETDADEHSVQEQRALIPFQKVTANRLGLRRHEDED